MGGSFSLEDDQDDKKDPPAKYDEKDFEKDRERRECRGYEKFQKQACKCVPKDKWQGATEDNLKAFYKTHNPEKLTATAKSKTLLMFGRSGKERNRRCSRHLLPNTGPRLFRSE